jgi:hypothetical protein
MTTPLYQVGQKVVFVNDYGVNWGEKTVTEVRTEEVRGIVYHYEPTTTPWFATSERNLFDPLNTPAIFTAMVDRYILNTMPVIIEELWW